jgi:hypothetical protein
MPIVQLDDNTGENIGKALGAVGGYFATQKQRKADKAAATTRQANIDAQNAEELKARIAGQKAQAKHLTDSDAYAGLQRTALTNALAKVSKGPPPGATGPALAAWAAKIKTDAMNVDHLTAGPEQATLEKALTDAVQQQHDSAIEQQDANLKLPPNFSKMTPQQKVDYLRVRQAAGQKTRNDKLFTDTETQIKDVQNPAEQQAKLAQQKQEFEQRLEQARAMHDQSLAQALTLALTRNARGESITPVEAARLGLDEKKYDLDLKKFNAEYPGGKKPLGLAEKKYDLDLKKFYAQYPGGKKPLKDQDQAGSDGDAAPQTTVRNGKTYYLHADENWYLTP